MAPSRWSTLPPEILEKISKILNTEVDTLRLRSVCSSWRSSLPPIRKPSCFPLKVPPIWNCTNPTTCGGGGGLFLLNYTTLYRLSPPEIGPRAGDTSDGWLFRVLEVNPNRFTLSSPLVPIMAKYAPGTVPEYLNLLEYRITEICKCYSLTFVDDEGYVTDILGPVVEKVSVLSTDCDFVVFVMFEDGTSSCWKYGDKDWTRINKRAYDICDLMVLNQKCYAISVKGVLFEFDSRLKPKVIPMPPLPVVYYKTVNYLLQYKSDLYVVLKTMGEDDSDDEDAPYGPDVPFRVKVFKKCGKNWEHVEYLRDELFISSEDVSIGLPMEDFGSSKENCVHVAMTQYICSSLCRKRIVFHGVYDLTQTEVAYMELIPAGTFMSWPPPAWLLCG